MWFKRIPEDSKTQKLNVFTMILQTARGGGGGLNYFGSELSKDAPVQSFYHNPLLFPSLLRYMN